MRYDLRDLGCKKKAGWRLLVPPLDGRKGWSSVIGAVNFNRVELSRVIREALPRIHAARIERAVPSFGRKGRRSDANFSHSLAILHPTMRSTARALFADSKESGTFSTHIWSGTKRSLAVQFIASSLPYQILR